LRLIGKTIKKLQKRSNWFWTTKSD